MKKKISEAENKAKSFNRLLDAAEKKRRDAESELAQSTANARSTFDVQKMDAENAVKQYLTRIAVLEKENAKLMEATPISFDQINPSTGKPSPAAPGVKQPKKPQKVKNEARECGADYDGTVRLICLVTQLY